MNETLRSWFDGQSWREATQLPETSPPFFAAWAYLATLAYPDSFDERNVLLAAIRSLWARHNKKVGAGYRPEYIQAVSTRDMRRRLDRTTKLINNRLTAARMARDILLSKGFLEALRDEQGRQLQNALLSQRPRGESITWTINHGAVQSLTVPIIDSMRKAGWVEKSRNGEPLPEGWRHDVELADRNLRQRVWVPSKSVLHLALAIEEEILKEPTASTLIDLSGRPEWVQSALGRLPFFAFVLDRVVNIDPIDLVMLIPGPA